MPTPVQNINNHSEKLSFALALPPKEGVMFLTDIPYQTGSDYTPEQLCEHVFEKCTFCWDGWVWSAFGPDDYDRDVCTECDGTGFIAIESLKTAV
jgi:hypothetical protein